MAHRIIPFWCPLRCLKSQFSTDLQKITHNFFFLFFCAFVASMAQLFYLSILIHSFEMLSHIISQKCSNTENNYVRLQTVKMDYWITCQNITWKTRSDEIREETNVDVCIIETVLLNQFKRKKKQSVRGNEKSTERKMVPCPPKISS